MLRLWVGFGMAMGLWAQGTDAVLTGTVTDPAGAVIPGATVTAKNTGTGIGKRVETGEGGTYVVPALSPGMYSITAERTGFRTVTIEGLRLEVGARQGLNIPMQLASTSEVVEVRAAADTALGFETSSVGGMLNAQQVLDLPLPSRDALSLVYTQAGLLGDNFGGSRRGALNITLDGINVQDQRLNQGVSSPITTTVDKVEEFRVVTSPADAEYGRGSGQIQILSRSGSNRFKGSLFETHRNTVLNANNWFNNSRGNDPTTGAAISPRNVLIRNQYGGRIGGPIKKNQTFFFFLFDGQRIRERRNITNTVYTETARQGLFRYFPGARNANALAALATVDLDGKPVAPRTATGALQTVSLFGIDPNRTVADPTGTIRRMIGLTPLPNNFRSGDGLNTAGFTWQRPSSQNRDQWNLRVDHNFNSAHRLSVSYTKEDQANANLFSEAPFPNAPSGETTYTDRLWTVNLTSTLRPTLLNEFRAGVLRPALRFYTGWEVGKNLDLLPKANGTPYVLDFDSVTDPINQTDNPVGRISPLYQFSDNVTYINGKHNFKGGIDVRFSSSNGFNSTDVMPRAVLGSGTAVVRGLDALPGIGLNLTPAIALINELSGSVSRVNQAFNSPGGSDPAFIPGEVKQRTWKRREYGMFFKDDWKIHRRLTLNLGGRWDYYGVPYDANGRTASLVGGQAGVFGLSGSSFADLYQPGRLNGALTRVELVGPGSANPNKALHAQDRNNFAPAVGLSWALPWFKKTTVLRTGYMINYERNSLRIADAVSGDQPGLRQLVVFNPDRYVDLRGVALPLANTTKPLETVPLTDRTQIVRVFEDKLRNPYIQNWNISLQRELAKNMVWDVRYVGSKGTRLVRGTSVNETNIFENGILDAFRVTQRGGNAPLFDQIFRGINVAGLGVVDGVRITGSDAVRTNTTTQGYLAFHTAANLADWLNTTTTYTGTRGGLISRAGLPVNFVVPNPQFDSARLTGNFASSTWHSFQTEVSRRFSKGLALQTNYTWSKALGEEEGDGEEMIDSYRDLRNWKLDKRRMSFHRTHMVRSSGTYVLPLRGRTTGWMRSALSRWQFGWIINAFSGTPISITSGRASYNTFGDNTASAVAPFSKGTGAAAKTENGVIYFSGLQTVPDPSIASITAINNIRSRSTLQGIADASGKILLVNPTAGQLGTLAPGFLEGPGELRFDINLAKRIPLNERFNMEVRVDAIDALNRPQWSDPNVDMNSVNFGRITAAGGNRIVVLQMRLDF
ncbi:MAG: TonB-dependent receptor [Acidobacteria bacterium]|nr:TonB-dependent receptor [Acidobacteriota bacterium]